VPVRRFRQSFSPDRLPFATSGRPQAQKITVILKQFSQGPGLAGGIANAGRKAAIAAFGETA